MSRAEVMVGDEKAGILSKSASGYTFRYHREYSGPDVSLTMPVRAESYEFDSFPSYFDGLLPEGARLEALLRVAKLDRSDYLSQLIVVGADLVGHVTIKAVREQALA